MNKQRRKQIYEQARPENSAKVTCYSTSKQTGILVIRAYLSRFPYSR